jgi:hypothetical protein
MAFHALRNMPMPGMVTRDAIQLRVLGDVGLHLLVRLGMTCMTALFQAAVGVQPHRSMRIVTSRTFFQIRPMGLSVTRVTLRKDIFVGHFSRPIYMIGFVTLRTRHLMLTTVFLEKVEVTGMTAPALVCLEGFNLLVVGRGNLS